MVSPYHFTSEIIVFVIESAGIIKKTHVFKFIINGKVIILFGSAFFLARCAAVLLCRRSPPLLNR